MGGGKDGGGRYHHGRLRRAVMDAALGLAAERGLGRGFSMREVARRAGVSHNAPYHHFADGGALVEALALESFGALREELSGAREGARGDAVEKLLAVCVAYVRFALENPARFRFMFRPELRTGRRAELAWAAGEGAEGDAAQAGREEGTRARLAARAVCGMLEEAVAECQAAGLAAPGDPYPAALTAWAAVHGLAVLMLDGPEGGVARTAEEAERAAKVVTETLARGLLARREAGAAPPGHT